MHLNYFGSYQTDKLNCSSTIIVSKFLEGLRLHLYIIVYKYLKHSEKHSWFCQNTIAADCMLVAILAYYTTLQIASFVGF